MFSKEGAEAIVFAVIVGVIIGFALGVMSCSPRIMDQLFDVLELNHKIPIQC